MNFGLAIFFGVVGVFFFWPALILAVVFLLLSLTGDLRKFNNWINNTNEDLRNSRAAREYLAATKECVACYTRIDTRATRCPNCTADQPADTVRTPPTHSDEKHPAVIAREAEQRKSAIITGFGIVVIIGAIVGITMVLSGS